MDKDAYAQLWVKAHAKNESALKAVLDAYFGDQVGSIIRRLQETWVKSSHKDSAGSVAGLVFNPHEWDKRLVEAVEPFYMRSAATGAVLELDQFQKAADDDDVLVDVPADVLQRIRKFSQDTFEQDYWAGINETTQGRLARAIADGLRDGDSLNEITARVSDSIGTAASEARALVIARTEVTGATNAGHYAAREALAADGLITTQQWLSIEDNDTRESHSEADGQEVSMSDMFSVGGEQTPFPGWFGLSPEERVNCRCVAVSSGTFADG
jgi:hypothetical protein